MEVGSQDHKKVILTDLCSLLRTVVYDAMAELTTVAVKKTEIKEVDPNKLGTGAVSINVGDILVGITYKYPIVSLTIDGKNGEKFSDVFRFSDKSYDVATSLVVLFGIAKDDEKAIAKSLEEKDAVRVIEESISEAFELLAEAKNAAEMRFGDACKFAMNGAS